MALPYWQILTCQEHKSHLARENIQSTKRGEFDPWLECTQDPQHVDGDCMAHFLQWKLATLPQAQNVKFILFTTYFSKPFSSKQHLLVSSTDVRVSIWQEDIRKQHIMKIILY